MNYLKDTVNHTYCVTFQDISGGMPVSRHWDFGNGQTSTSPTPTICFQYPGLYSVKLIVENPTGVFDSISKYLMTDTNSIVCDYNVGITGFAPNDPLLSIQINNNKITIDFVKPEQDVKINIYNLSGQVISSTGFKNVKNATISLATRSAGVHVLSIVLINAIINKKILLQQ